MVLTLVTMVFTPLHRHQPSVDAVLALILMVGGVTGAQFRRAARAKIAANMRLLLGR
jgi:hypothetical protein